MRNFLINLFAPITGSRNWQPNYDRDIRKPITIGSREMTTDQLVYRRWTGEAWEFKEIPVEELDELQWWQAVK